MQLAWIHLAIYLALLYWECTFVGFAVRPRRVHSLLFSLPLYPSVCTEPAQIRFYCIYLFIYSYLFSISEASYQRPPNLRSRVAGELPGLHLSPYERVCVCFGIKLKYKWKGNIGIITFVIASYAVYGSHCYQTPPGWWNRKRWNVLTSWLTEYLLSNIINHWQGVLQGEWNSF